MKTVKKIIFMVLVSAISLTVLPSSTKAVLNNNFVISNENFRNVTSMSANDINNLLRAHGSWLADYTIPENISVEYPTTSGEQFTTARQFNDVGPAGHQQLFGKTVAELIFEECVEHNMNPQVVLTILQKESSSLSRSMSDMDNYYTNSRSWPMFYNYDDHMLGCFNHDTSSCSDTKYGKSTYEWRAQNYGGIGQQIAYGTAWMAKTFDNYNNGSYRNGYAGFSCDNAATCVLYTYTPAVQNSFYNIYSELFGDPASIPLTSTNIMYRFWSDRFHSHFYTTDPSERNKLISSDPNWKYEGTLGTVFSDSDSETYPVYRFWSNKFNSHFYTADQAERDYLINNDPNWKYEQVGFYARTAPLPNCKPIYRFWSDKFHSHFYTADQAERDYLINNDPNWKYEQVAYYIPNE